MGAKRIDPKLVLGWGVDADPANNPTYPQRDVTRDDKSGMSWTRPAQQVATVEILKSTERPSLSAVFGTGQPPRRLSGLIRRRAFRKSEGKWGHWLLLMGADRIDVVEGLFEDLGRGRLRDIFGGRRTRFPSNATNRPVRGSKTLSFAITLGAVGAAIYVLTR